MLMQVAEEKLECEVSLDHSDHKKGLANASNLHSKESSQKGYLNQHENLYRI